MIKILTVFPDNGTKFDNKFDNRVLVRFGCRSGVVFRCCFARLQMRDDAGATAASWRMVQREW